MKQNETVAKITRTTSAPLEVIVYATIHEPKYFLINSGDWWWQLLKVNKKSTPDSASFFFESGDE